MLRIQSITAITRLWLDVCLPYVQSTLYCITLAFLALLAKSRVPRTRSLRKEKVTGMEPGNMQRCSTNKSTVSGVMWYGEGAWAAAGRLSARLISLHVTARN